MNLKATPFVLLFLIGTAGFVDVIPAVAADERPNILLIVAVHAVPHGGAGNHWNALGFNEGGSTYRADGEITEWPQGRYSTDLFQRHKGYTREGGITAPTKPARTRFR